MQVSLVGRVVCNGRSAKSEDSSSVRWSVMTLRWITERLAERLAERLTAMRG